MPSLISLSSSRSALLSLNWFLGNATEQYAVNCTISVVIKGWHYMDWV